MVENFSELADGDWSMDDAYAAIDIVTGFGDEAKKGAKLLDIAGSSDKKVDTKSVILDIKHNITDAQLSGQGDRPQDAKPPSPKTVKGKIMESIRFVSEALKDLGG